MQKGDVAAVAGGRDDVSDNDGVREAGNLPAKVSGRLVEGPKPAAGCAESQAACDGVDLRHRTDRREREGPAFAIGVEPAVADSGRIADPVAGGAALNGRGCPQPR